MRARIYQQPKSAMQSGVAQTHEWVLAYQREEAQRNDPLMGWAGSGDMRSQLVLRFGTREEAIAYAERNTIPYDIELPAPRRMQPKVYADNFKYGRAENWTH
jgi:hypothetical protein